MEGRGPKFLEGRRLTLIARALARHPAAHGPDDPGDPFRTLRLRWLAEALEADGARELLTLHLQRRLAALTFLEPKDAQKEWQDSGELITALTRLLLPDASRPPQETLAEAMRRQYITAYGDPANPEVKARAEATARALREGGKKKRTTKKKRGQPAARRRKR